MNPLLAQDTDQEAQTISNSESDKRLSDIYPALSILSDRVVGDGEQNPFWYSTRRFIPVNEGPFKLSQIYYSGTDVRASMSPFIYVTAQGPGPYQENDSRYVTDLRIHTLTIYPEVIAGIRQIIGEEKTSINRTMIHSKIGRAGYYYEIVVELLNDEGNISTIAFANFTAGLNDFEEISIYEAVNRLIRMITLTERARNN